MQEIKQGRIYRHFKGDYYIVEGFAQYSEGGCLVLYRSLYGDGTLYARPYDMFASKVDREKYPNVKQEYRFQLQNVESVATKFTEK